MASYENLSDSELRQKLLEIGLDVPVSVNREFLIKKLKSVREGGTPNKNGGTPNTRRRSVGRSTAVEKETSATITAVSPGGHHGPTGSRAKSRLSLSEISSTGSPKRGGRTNHNLELSVDTGPSHVPSTRSSRSRLSTANSGYASPFHSTILGDEGEQNGRETRTETYATPVTDVSWSKKSDPKEWTRYSSLFPSTPSSTPPTTSTPSSSSSGGIIFPSGALLASTSPSSLSSSLHVTNGSWNHSPSPGLATTAAATPGSRLSGLTRRSFGPSSGSSDMSPVTSVSERLTQQHHFYGGTSDRGHFISKVLVGIAVLFFAVIAILYLNLSYNQNAGKVPGLSAMESSVSDDKHSASNKAGPQVDPSVLTSNYPLCGTFEDEDLTSCIPPALLKTARVLFSTLKDELILRAKWKPCSDVQDRVPLSAAKSLLYHLSDKKKSEVDDCFNSMLILCVENPNWGLRIEKESGEELLNRFDLKSLDPSTATISAVNVVPTFYCNAFGYVQSIFFYFLYVCAVAVISFGVYKGVTYYQKRRRDQENEVFLYVDNILQMLQEQYEHAKEHGTDPFLAVTHIRDTLLPAQERISKAALWDKVKDHISNHESRVREEIQHISGEEFRVWRWLPSASPAVSRKSRLSMGTPPGTPNNITPPSTPSPTYNTTNCARSPAGTPQVHYAGTGTSASKWQGQAFELSDKGPNAPPVLTNCLKIRQMFDKDAIADEDREARITRAILEKCPDSAICHIAVEHASAEGCVYVKCATKEDAKRAYLALHGWWFDGHLLSVKFLREERYLVRFPWAKNCTTPLRRL